MKCDLPYNISKLIVSYINGVIDESELHILAIWRNESDENELLFQRLIVNERFVGYTERYQQYDYMAKFLEFDTRRRDYNRRKWIKRFGFAAAVLLPLFMVMIFFNRELSIDERFPLVSVNIQSGSSKARIVLPDGQVYDLGNRDILEIPGVKVDKDSLVYIESLDESVLHELIVPRGGEFFLVLSDGTRVWLNSETKLRYPVSFNSNRREVYLEGEAYFDVTENVDSPFVVVSGKQQVIVLGTCFVVRCYIDEEFEYTTLESGSVLVKADYGDEKLLMPGQLSKMYNGKIEVSDVNTSIYTAWRKGKFVFESQKLGDIMHTLSRWYDIEVIYSNPDLRNILFTGEFIRYSDITEWFKNFEVLEKVKFSVHGKTVTVSPYQK